MVTFFGWSSSTLIVKMFSTGASVFGCEAGGSPARAEKASINVGLSVITKGMSI